MYSFAQRVQSVYCKACSGGVDGLRSLTVLGDQKEAILPVRMAPFHHAAYRAAIFHKTVSSISIDFAMGIGRCVNDDLLNELMQDTGCQLRDIGVLADNGQKPVNIGTFAFCLFDFLTEYCSLCLQTSLFRFIVGGQLVETFVCQLAADAVLIQPLEDHIQFCDTLLAFRQ